MNYQIVLALTALCLAAQVSGHGMMIKPPNRSSMWRYGYNTPPNYNDNQNYCGGFTVQWNDNQGKCGICGDDFKSRVPRDNEDGGTYGLGIVVGEYTSGSDIEVIVNLTASHRGHFEFSICNMDISGESEECFQPLNLSDGRTVYEVEGGPKVHSMNIHLRDGLTCQRCSLRWHYRAGNTYGQCDDGTSATGCGPQETFRNCADISIH